LKKEKKKLKPEIVRGKIGKRKEKIEAGNGGRQDGEDRKMAGVRRLRRRLVQWRPVGNKRAQRVREKGAGQ
jgi:hypothetical protein